MIGKFNNFVSEILKYLLGIFFSMGDVETLYNIL